MSSTPLLSVSNLHKTFVTDGYEINSVIDVSFAIHPGECLGVVGESGSGKSTLANLILGFHQPTSGSMQLADQELIGRRSLAQRKMIQLVNQNPLSALNPRRSIGASVRLALDVHNIGKVAERQTIVAQRLEEVGLPAEFAQRRPDALSGGQRQRVSIARALACKPQLIVLDEPTSALDVLVQARVLLLLAQLRIKHGLTYMFITHDLAVVRNFADRIAVMERGKLVELNSVDQVFTKPKHPYTQSLIQASPVITPEELQLREQISTMRV